MRTTGLILAAGSIAAANELVFAPLASGHAAKTVSGVDLTSFNWRLIPATGILALTLAGLESLAPDFAVGLAGLVVLAVLVIKVGNAPTPLENIATVVSGTKG
jgi:hypothetical protein